MDKANLIDNTVTAIIGQHSEKITLENPDSAVIICRDTGIPFFPSLGVRQNAMTFHIAMTLKQQSLFWELLKVSGLRRAGWNLPFRKDQPGKLRMWGMVLALTLQTGPVLAIEPMAGMTPEDRTDFANLLRYCQEHGLRLAYTTFRLKDVMELGVNIPLHLATPTGWRETDMEEMERERSAMGEETGWDAFQLQWEEKENG